MSRTNRTTSLTEQAIEIIEAKKRRLEWVKEKIDKADREGNDAKLEDIIYHLDSVSIPHNF